MTPPELAELDAWLEWYEAAAASLRRLRRVGEKFWGELPWDGPLGRDNQLRHLEGDRVAADANLALERLDHLAVIELFSIFEGAVRTLVAEQVRDASAGLSHPMLKAAARGAIDAAERRSFAEILNSYSKGGHADLAEQVRQIRRFRNWVSHGRRGREQTTVDPKVAYQRLRRFLELLLPKSPNPTGGIPDAIP